MTKKTKHNLKRDFVTSDRIHVGIELELMIPRDEFEHDHDACDEAQEEALNNNTILSDYLNLPRDLRPAVAEHFNFNAWRREYMESWSCDGDCG